MTARGFYTLFFGLVLLVTALSVGSGGAFLLGVLALGALLVSLLSCMLAALTLRLTQHVDTDQVVRGESALYTLSVRMFAPIPVAPISLQICLPSGRESEFLLAARLIGETTSENPLACPHVGVRPIGVTQVRVKDCFSLFSFSSKVRAPLTPITVLPAPAEADVPPFSPGEGEHSAAQRAQSDHTTPVDTRAWQDGDELKRVHWKLSMRRQELMVHTYETPQRPDALILLDCAAPSCAPQLRAHVIDALTEECAGVVKALLEAGHTARMPLCGKAARELSGQDATALPTMLEALAQEPFDATPEFERVLMLSARRMRRTGATVIFTTRLTPRVADTVIALSRMGPRTQLTLVTDENAAEQQEKLIRLLQRSGVSARHVRAV